MISNTASILTAERGNVQVAINEAYEMALEAIDCFEKAASKLLTQPAPSSIFWNELQTIVNGIRDTWVGTLDWQ